MAIIFISPKKQRRSLAFGVFGVTLLVVCLMAIAIFSPSYLAGIIHPKGTLPYLPPDIAIDMSVFTSDQVQSLELFNP